MEKVFDPYTSILSKKRVLLLSHISVSWNTLAYTLPWNIIVWFWLIVSVVHFYDFILKQPSLVNRKHPKLETVFFVCCYPWILKWCGLESSGGNIHSKNTKKYILPEICIYFSYLINIYILNFFFLARACFIHLIQMNEDNLSSCTKYSLTH